MAGGSECGRHTDHITGPPPRSLATQPRNLIYQAATHTTSKTTSTTGKPPRRKAIGASNDPSPNDDTARRHAATEIHQRRRLASAVPISVFPSKNTRETAQAINGWKLERAVKFLENVQEHKEAVATRRYASGTGRAALGTPDEDSQDTELTHSSLQGAEANADTKGLDTGNLVVKHGQGTQYQHLANFQCDTRLGVEKTPEGSRAGKHAERIGSGTKTETGRTGRRVARRAGYSTGRMVYGSWLPTGGGLSTANIAPKSIRSGRAPEPAVAQGIRGRTPKRGGYVRNGHDRPSDRAPERRGSGSQEAPKATRAGA